MTMPSNKILYHHTCQLLAFDPVTTKLLIYSMPLQRDSYQIDLIYINIDHEYNINLT